MIFLKHLQEREATTNTVILLPTKASKMFLPRAGQRRAQLLRSPAGAHPPDDGNELRHAQLLGNKKLGFVQERKVFLFMVSLNNYLF